MEGDAQKGKKKGKGKGKGKGKARRDSDSSSGSDFDSEGRPGRPSREGALRTKDLAEDEVCCINHLWRICVHPECKYKHKEFLHKERGFGITFTCSRSPISGDHRLGRGPMGGNRR